MIASPPRTLEFRRPWLYPKQRDALFGPTRYAICEASTKSGKTTGCMIWLVEQAFKGKEGYPYFWVAPIFAQAKIAFRRIKRALPSELYTANETELTITLVTGAVIWFKGADKPDSLYGENVYAAVIDEASRCKIDVWYAVRSTLTASQGPARIIGNVTDTDNWAYQLARRAEKGIPDWHYAKLTAYDAVEAKVLPLSEVEDAQRTLPDDVFRELYLAEPRTAKALIYATFTHANITDTATYQPGKGPLFLFYDWGFVDPAAILFLQYREGAFYQFAELTGSGRSEREWVQESVRLITNLPGYAGPSFEEWGRAWTRNEWPDQWPDVWPEYAAGDPSAPQFRSEWKEHGITTKAPKAVKHEVEAGQDVARAAMRTAGDVIRYYVNPGNRATVESLQKYRSQQLSDGSFGPKPDGSPANHAWSHCPDALRYGLWTLRRWLGLGSTGEGESDGE